MESKETAIYSLHVVCVYLYGVVKISAAFRAARPDLPFFHISSFSTNHYRSYTAIMGDVIVVLSKFITYQ